MYSLLQMKSTFVKEEDDDIFLPQMTSDGDTTLNGVKVNHLFSLIPLRAKYKP